MKLSEIGAQAVLIKGGHLGGKSDSGDQKSARRSSNDLLAEDGDVTIFTAEWIDAPPVRGSGCMMSSAIAACLARGVSMKEAVSLAKEYVGRKIREQLNQVITQM